MSMLSKLKNNSFLRGLCFLTRSIGNHFVVCKKKFAQYADNVVVIPPLCIISWRKGLHWRKCLYFRPQCQVYLQRQLCDSRESDGSHR